MSQLLALARDYIDRMTNPGYGLETNEEYSLRFGQLLENDNFEKSFRNEITELHDKNTLTSNGWLWLIQWSRSREVSVSEDLLFELFEEWSSIPAKCAIVDLATYRAELPKTTKRSLRNFPNDFLAKTMRAATEPIQEQVQSKSPAFFEFLRETAKAESLLVVLMQVGTPLTLRAASTLLKHQWKGHDLLFEYLLALANTLDNETREVWGKELDVSLTLK